MRGYTASGKVTQLSSISYTQKFYHNVFKSQCPGLPSGPVIKNPPASAGDMGLIPGVGRFHMLWGNWAHGLQLLSPHTRACSTTRETTAVRSLSAATKSRPHLLQIAKAHMQQEDPAQPPSKKKKKTLLKKRSQYLITPLLSCLSDG